MTNEEAIEVLKNDIEICTIQQEQACDMAIKALEQQNKRGHWIRVTDEAGYLVWECDKCGWQQRFNTNFCSDCGAKMEE